MTERTIFTLINTFDSVRPQLAQNGVDQAQFEFLRTAQLALARNTRELMERLDLRVGNNYGIFLSLAGTLFTDKEIAAITGRHWPEAPSRNGEKYSALYFYALIRYAEDDEIAIIRQKILEAADARIAEVSKAPDLLEAATRKMRDTASEAVSRFTLM